MRVLVEGSNQKYKGLLMFEYYTCTSDFKLPLLVARLTTEKGEDMEVNLAIVVLMSTSL